MSERRSELLASLTLEEKADVVTGEGLWTTRAVERVGVPQMTVTDGPNGARGGGLLGTGQQTACIPAGSVLGATWDVDLVRRLGVLLGEEARAKGANVLLAPTINLHRNPLGGRDFECYSEDPELSGWIAIGFVEGVQSQGVATTLKHLVCNDSEFERHTIDVQVDERTLREVYLRPFEMAVKHAAAWGVMSAYNRLNGTHCSEHEWLLRTVLRDEWGFDGFVVSDWFATRSTAPSISAGQSLEMPGEGKFYGRERIVAAIEAGDLDEADLDRVVLDMLTLAERTGAFDGVGGGEEQVLDRPEDRALVREASAAGTVLVRNDGVLPLDPDAVGSIAVIGPNGRVAKIMGGGSATVRAYRAVSPLDALTARYGDSIDVRYAQGCDINRSTPALAEPLLASPFQIDFFAGHELDGPVVASAEARTAELLFFGPPQPEVPEDAYSLRASATLRSQVSGPHTFELVQCGRARLRIGDTWVIDATEGDHGRGDSFFGFGSAPIPVTVDLTAGEEVEIVLEASNRDAILLTGFTIGFTVDVEVDLLAEAEKVASDVDVALVIVGTNDDWETEGRDRDQFELPGDQVELIERVSAANARTIVVTNTGGPHDMSWLDQPAAVLCAGFGGQEFGDALVDVLVGDVDPGGRMPTTIPMRYEHSAAYLNYPGENSVVRYGEGLHIGYRWFDARHIDVAVPFGHGLSYASYDWANAVVEGSLDTSDETPCVVRLDVTNTSARAGSEVIQIYVEPPESVLHRPTRELKAFAKVHLAPGESATVELPLDATAFRYFDPGDAYHDDAVATAEVPAVGAARRRTTPGWYLEPGTYRLALSRSIIDPVETLEVTLTGEEQLLPR